MKRLIISCIMILVLTNQAFAMGWLGGGGGGGSSAGASSGGKSNANASANANANANSNTNTTSTFIATANNTNNSGNNGIIDSNIGGTDGQGSGGNSTNGPVSTPELTTMFLLGSALFGLWGLRRKIKKIKK